jgi:hypothetical protein
VEPKSRSTISKESELAEAFGFGKIDIGQPRAILLLVASRESHVHDKPYFPASAANELHTYSTGT